MDWNSFIQGLSSKAVDVYAADRQAARTYETGQLQLQQAAQQQAAATAAAQSSAISPKMLLIGGAALVAVLVLANK